MRIGICENEPFIREQLITLIHNHPTSEPRELAVFASGEDMLSDSEGFDLAFLDIELGDGISGLALAEALQARARPVLIIFVTSYQQYVTDAFHLNTFSFLLKPIDSKRFAEEFSRGIARYHSDHRHFTINQYGELIPILITDILYIKASGRLIEVYVRTRKEPYQAYGPLKKVQKELLPHHFIPVDRGYLVNLRYVHGGVTDSILLAYWDKDKVWRELRLSVSRRRRDEVAAWVQRYILEQESEGGAP